MSRKSWLVWGSVGVIAAVVCAVTYYRGGGETTWPFVLLTAFVAVWIPTQVWIRRKTAAKAAEIGEQRAAS